MKDKIKKLLTKLKQLFCNHYWTVKKEWEDIPENCSNMEFLIARLNWEYCECKCCGKETFLSTSDYIEHLKDTKRIK